MSAEKSANEAVIVSAVRTPIGSFMGQFGTLPATELGARAVAAAVERAGVDPDSVYEVIMGHVVAAGAGQAPARQAALNGGLPATVGAASVNKVCGSGLKAVMLASNGIRAGEADVYVAGGMESMSTAPYLLPKARAGLRFGHGAVEDAVLKDGLWCSFEQWPMGDAAEFIARQFEIGREEMDAFALQSHEKAARATAAGRFAAEIVPIEVKIKRQMVRAIYDEPIRAEYHNGHYELTTSAERLANLPPAFAADGAVTAGNAPGLNDGAAALVIMSRAAAEQQGLAPLARIVGYTHAAVTPQWIFSAPAQAIPRLLKRLDWSLDDVDLIELNEAFAAQVLANGVDMERQGLPWDWEKVNVHGGAVALGHPIGASGARVLVTLVHALRQRGRRRGIASLCLGGGEAVALAVEMEA
ncbi:MAG: acetyl-CoA C-acyltransferase [Anaerolineales bacterium]|nr:acetyl-CoA C-acyltransferase [Anaerolineales bacterium]MCB0005733.1 acetyl-CoA C-acyltransferase [Anaerolineales bacterium]MCB0013348.1 acetyl-CoA C-acyltransferase [Anaerolineales bacterium]